MNIKRIAIGVAIYLCLFAVGFGLAGNANASENTEFKVFGYVKMDAMYTDYSDGDLPANSALRDFLIVAVIPVGGEPGSGVDGKFDRLQFSVQYGFNWNSL